MSICNTHYGKKGVSEFTEQIAFSGVVAKDILSNPNNIELQIIRGPNERSATREKHPNTSNELPSNDTIPQTLPEVNSETQ